MSKWEAVTEDIIQTASRQDTTAAEAHDLVARLAEEMQDMIDTAWLGDAADAFKAKFDEWLSQGGDLQDKLSLFTVALGTRASGVAGAYLTSSSQIGGSK